MSIYFQNYNKTQVSVRNTNTLVENANSPKVVNYTTNNTTFGSDNYTKFNLQFAGIFNIGKKQYKRLSTPNHA